MSLVSERRIEFSQPIRQVALMLVVLALVGIGASLIFGALRQVFDANPYLNGFILGVFVVGVLACFWQMATLTSAVSWLEGFAIDRPGHEFVDPPRLLISFASLLRDKRARTALTATSTRSILDSVATRLDEQRDITRYIANLLILIGLLGTFWGLSRVVPGIVETMRGLAGDDAGGDPLAMFSNLMGGLNAQLDGMATAFASSLLGLAGSLVVGLLDLFAGHGQNRFYRELEEWLATITRISLGSGEGDGGGLAVEALMRTADQTEALVEALRAGEESRGETVSRLDALAAGFARLADALEEDRARALPPPPPPPAFDAAPLTAALGRLAEGQERIAALLAESRKVEEEEAEGRLRLRSIDMQLARLLEEVAAGRQESTAELRMDLARLTRAVMGELGHGHGHGRER